ncbi:hypothetical protein DFQ28_009999 [Apophysomyces sp. BC1034]|nr:hypothetical protein DFQ30_009657 [Apophysomyces sp. BC1015]KAG0172145.1 hypothetical protein DFQ29_008524 [Apophysomyces sp. BC1021]KAG0185058.1 hypothetical protein DFQ28_009999 [Apophysomyces sp. BC1034]
MAPHLQHVKVMAAKYTIRHLADVHARRWLVSTTTPFTAERFQGATVKSMYENGELNMTDKAVQRLKHIVGQENDDEMLRITVDLDEQKGLQNKVTLTKMADEDDTIFEKDGVRVVVDGMTLNFIEGSTVDFVEELIGSSFQVISPQPKAGRGSNVPYDIDIDLLTQN